MENPDKSVPLEGSVKIGGVQRSVTVPPEPDPQEVLRALLRSKRGKHKIYVGAAPGVGKTYRAVQELLERKAQGADVVIGYLESHGRTDVKDLANSLETFPRKVLEYMPGGRSHPQTNTKRLELDRQIQPFRSWLEWKAS